MSKKRGLSLEEKREQMLQIFYESQEFFLLKELEKMGPKKGVISQSVKDVVQSLVDDDLVLKDKIGTSVYFWSLPSCAGNQLRNTYNKLESDLSNSRKRYMDLVEHRDNLKRGREDSEEREAALEELKTVELHHKKLKEELAAYADSDPAAVEAMSMRWPLYTTLRMLLILLIQQLTGGQTTFSLCNNGVQPHSQKQKNNWNICTGRLGSQKILSICSDVQQPITASKMCHGMLDRSQMQVYHVGAVSYLQ
uniref:Mnd1 HTH domain-containing protein n=2 Tax=Zea mays TaxID=4577 RepID=A0A804ML25_MAIZE